MKKHHPQHERHRIRQGTILLLVLVVVMLLSFSLYSFSEGMLVQYAATKSSLHQLQLRQLAESGITSAADALANHAVRNGEDLTNNSKRFRNNVITKIDGSPAGFTLLHTLPTNQQPATFGLADESALLNINSLPLAPIRRKESRNRLLQLPQMTNHIADAILDWMDSDDDASEYGAESSWYTTQSPPYRPAQTGFRSLQELLLVKGISASMLFGEDRNQNGTLDAGEDTNGDQILQGGFSSYLTVHAAESTLHSDGSHKLNVNSNNLAELHDQLEVLFNADVARFIIAVRMAGLDSEGKLKKELTEEEKLEERIASANRRLAQQRGVGSDEGGLESLAASEDIDAGSRAGIILSPSPPYKISSLVDLIGSFVRISINNEDMLLKSPWGADANSVDKALRELSSTLTLTDGDRLVGRINVFQAPYEVLMTIPEMTESRARSIVRLQGQSHSSNQTSTSSTPATIAWLMHQGVADIRRLRQLAPHITSGGDVFHGVAVGHMEGIRSTASIRFMLDATYESPRLILMQDLPPMPSPINTPGQTQQHSRSRKRL